MRYNNIPPIYPIDLYPPLRRCGQPVYLDGYVENKGGFEGVILRQKLSRSQIVLTYVCK